MKQITSVMLLLTLTSCGTTATLKHPEEMSYISVSRFKASLIYEIFTGGIRGCKVSTHNMILGESTIILDEKGNCQVEASSVSD